MTHQLTIRYDEALAQAIDRVARSEGLSRNQAVVRLLRRGAKLDQPPVETELVGDSLDWFIGSWSEEQARELEEAVADFEMVDEELWR